MSRRRWSTSTRPCSQTTRSTSRSLGLRRRNDRVDVEDLATAERDTLTRLAEDEAVAGHERIADRQMHPDRLVPRFDRIGAEHANANGMLA